ncbi:MAG: GGDEF domain-containing protein [Spirochaetaceae bacterium]|nr:GGDEF domain-containing protein [Spirochaetaceae bacterium]
MSLITMLFCFIFFLGLLIYANYNKRFSGLKSISYGNLSLFLGFLFLGLRGIVPDFLSIILANFLIACAFFLFNYGTSLFLRIYFRFLWLNILGLVGVFISFLYFTYSHPQVNMRIIIINTFLLIESLLVSVSFLRQSSKQYKSQNLFGFWGFFLYFFFCLFRIIQTIGEGSISNFLEAGFIHGLAFIFMQLLIINTTFSVVWIANSVLNHDLETQANLDPLTKILNRRAFLDELNKELARSRRDQLTFSLIMADIDFFKSVNDNYGHLAGDSVLISFTRTVTENLRLNDVFSRYGGEEFMILLPNTNKKNAFETAERIRKIVEMNKHPFNGKIINFTVSFGVTSYDIDAQNKGELLENVDLALYEAKNNGRNRVEIK